MLPVLCFASKVPSEVIFNNYSASFVHMRLQDLLTQTQLSVCNILTNNYF